MTFLNLNVGQTFNEQVRPVLDILSAQYTPYLNKYKAMVGSMGSRKIWFNETLSNQIVTLNGAYTAGSGTMTLSAATNANPYKVTEGVTRIETQDGAATYKVVTWNSSTLVATIALEFGSDSSLATAVDLYLGKGGTVGEDFGNGDGDELQFATSDINYPSVIYHRLKSADPNEEGKWTTVGIDEARISHHERKLYIQNLQQLERNLFYSTRAAGTSASSRQSNTITAGLNSHAGGLAQFINAQGGRVADNSSATPINEDDIISDVQFIRERGGLTNMMSVDRSENQLREVDLYCSETTLGDINKFIRLERDEKALSGQVNGQFGTWATRLIANGAYVNVHVSTGVKNRDYFMLPATSAISHDFLYFFDEVSIGKTGHNEKKMYVSLFTTEVPNATSMVQRKNLSAL